MEPLAALQLNSETPLTILPTSDEQIGPFLDFDLATSTAKYKGDPAVAGFIGMTFPLSVTATDEYGSSVKFSQMLLVFEPRASAEVIIEDPARQEDVARKEEIIAEIEAEAEAVAEAPVQETTVVETPPEQEEVKQTVETASTELVDNMVSDDTILFVPVPLIALFNAEQNSLLNLIDRQSDVIMD